MSKRQTDNSFFYDKVDLRLSHLPKKNKINVLEVYGGDGKIWNKIKQLSNVDIVTTKIDIKNDKPGIYLKGDNMKFLKSLDLSQYDIIDLDAYGVPFGQLEIIFNSILTKKVHIFVTFIQTMFGALPKRLLYDLGYTKSMVNKCPALFNKNGFQKFKDYLALKGIDYIVYRNSNRKNYVYFIIN